MKTKSRGLRILLDFVFIMLIAAAVYLSILGIYKLRK